MRRMVVALLPFLLGGCGLPAGITTVAWIVDGASFVGTGKGVGDHALSAMVNEDCALWRVTMGERLCRAEGVDPVPAGPALAALDTDGADGDAYPGDGSHFAATAPQSARSRGWKPVLTLSADVVGAGRPGIAARAPALAQRPCPAGTSCMPGGDS